MSTAQQLALPDADESASFTGRAARLASASVQDDAAVSALEHDRYHPWISKVGGRKFVFGIVAMCFVAAFSGTVMVVYHPKMTGDQVELINAVSKWFAIIFSTFVGGNALKGVTQSINVARSPRDETV